MLVHDDVLATGGTVKAILDLVEQLGGQVVGVAFLIELTFLSGRDRLAGYDLHSLIEYYAARRTSGPLAAAVLRATGRTMSDVRRADGPLHLRVPCTRRRARHAVRLPAPRAPARRASHPAVYRVRFACPCGEEHVGLVGHDDLDWAPLGLERGPVPERDDARARRRGRRPGGACGAADRAGEWPWTFFCYPEERPRPAFPSSPDAARARRAGRVGVAVRCAVCSQLSVNLVSQQHLDVPFHNDRHVGVVQHLFADDARRTVEEFVADLYSAQFDVRRLSLD